MNYLFYLGIIIPTLITIVLFLVFIYCWFLQKARKEVLTKRYDPHGKMRRMGMSLDPPSPPPYCRVGSDFFSDSGEDNEAYDVSRSPSTEQNIRGGGGGGGGGGRPMYRTYHDSGISAGLSPTQENEPRPPGLSYRSCPDSGISGFGIQTMQTSACVHRHTCRGCCSDNNGGGGGENIQMQHMQMQHPLSVSLPQQQQQQHNQQLQQQPQQNLSCQQLEHIPSQQQPQHHQVILHQNTVQASVHPNHGVCYGDNTTHPQSPQHYNPPPFHHPHQAHFQAMEMGAVGGAHSNVNVLPNIQEQPGSCGLQRTGACSCNHPSPEHLNHNISPSAPAPPPPLQQQQSLSSPQHHTQACCNCSNEPYHIHQHQQQQQQQQLPIVNTDTTSTPQSAPQFNPRVDTSIPPPQTDAHANYVNGDPGIEPASFKPTTPFHRTQSKKGNNNNNNNTQTINNLVEYPPPPYQPSQQPTPISSQPYPSTSHNNNNNNNNMHSFRGQNPAVNEMAPPTATNSSSSPSDRPDSQASTSSTTDSEDSGFRSSHCPQQQQHHNSLNKHGNPLLKPLRRPRNNPKLKSGGSKSGKNGNSANTGTPLTTLNPQNLSSQHNELGSDVIQNTLLLDRGDASNTANNMSNARALPRALHLNGQNGGGNSSMLPGPNSGQQRILAQQQQQQQQQPSPIRETDWSAMISPKDAAEPTLSNKAKRLHQQQQQQQHPHPHHQQQQHFDTNDISTHLSWKYLQDMSAASSKSDGSSSSTDDTHRVVSPLLRHAHPEQPGDNNLFSYSVV